MTPAYGAIVTPAYPAAGTLVFCGAVGLSLVAVFGTAYAACAVVQVIRRRRADQASAAGSAQDVHDRGYLEILEREFRAMDAGERP